MKIMSKLIAVFASIALLFLFTSCEQSTPAKETPATTWSSVTSLNGFIGTWVSTSTTDMQSGPDTTSPVSTTTTLVNSGTSPVSYIWVQDYTDYVTALAEYMETDTDSAWEYMQTTMQEDGELPAGVTFSDGTPYILTQNNQMTEEMLFSEGATVEINNTGTQLRVTFVDEEGSSVQLFNKQ